MLNNQIRFQTYLLINYWIIYYNRKKSNSEKVYVYFRVFADKTNSSKTNFYTGCFFLLNKISTLNRFATSYII